MEQNYWVNVRDKLAFLSELMHYLSSNESQIILEGNLNKFDFNSIKKHELEGEYRCDNDTEVVSLRLTDEEIKPILNQIQPSGKFVHDIRHIQIRKNNEIELLVGDNFDNECISTGSLITPKLLEELKDKGIVRSYYHS